MLVASLIAGVAGYGYYKFNQIEKFAIDKKALNSVPDASAETVAYFPDSGEPQTTDAATTETTETVTSETPTTAVAPTTAPTEATAQPSNGGNPGSGPGTGVGAVPVPGTAAPATVADEDVTALTVDGGLTAGALDEAAAEDDAEVKGKKPAKEKVVFDRVGPGPIVKLDNTDPFGGPNAKNYLMIGVDDRSAVAADQKSGFGSVGGSRTDTIIVMRIDADSNQAWLLSIPRDLWLPQAGTGQPMRVNAAFAKGGATSLVRTISERLGIPIAHVVKINFAGFQKVVDTVGGVNICFPKPTRDKVSSLAERPAGCQNLDGRAATAYVRSRHYQQQDSDGVWKEDPRGDLGRIVRQQSFIRGVMGRALEQSSNPLTANAMVDSFKTAIQLDGSFTFPETAKLGSDLRSFDPSSLQTFTLPTTGAQVKTAKVLKLNTKSAAAILSKFRSAK